MSCMYLNMSANSGRRGIGGGAKVGRICRTCSMRWGASEVSCLAGLSSSNSMIELFEILLAFSWATLLSLVSVERSPDIILPDGPVENMLVLFEREEATVRIEPNDSFSSFACGGTFIEPWARHCSCWGTPNCSWQQPHDHDSCCFEASSLIASRECSVLCQIV